MSDYEPQRGDGHVYIIKFPESGLLKVGFSKNVIERLHQIRFGMCTGKPPGRSVWLKGLVVVGVIPGDKALEREIQLLLKGCIVQGTREFFYVNAALATLARFDIKPIPLTSAAIKRTFYGDPIVFPSHQRKATATGV